MITLQAFRRAVILRHQRQTLRLISYPCSHPGITRSLYSHIAIPGGRNNIRRIEKQGQEVEGTPSVIPTKYVWPEPNTKTQSGSVLQKESFHHLKL